MTVEQQLREALQGKTQTVTGWTDPVSRVEQGVRRRKRRRLAAQAVAAVTVLVTVLTVGLVQWRHPETPSLVDAAIDATIDDAAGLPYIQRRSPRTDRDPCLADRLKDVEWIVQSAPWGLSTGFGLAVSTEKRCTVSGRPRLFGVDVATGQRVEVPFVATPPAADNGRARQFPATIDPGEKARVAIHGSADCPAGQSPQSFRGLTLLFDGRELTIPEQRTLTAVCGAHVSEWFVEPPMEYASLAGYLAAPKMLRRGENFSYTVRLTNGYNRSFTLPGCPVYLLGLGPQGHGWRRLHCGIDSIGAHQSVHFQMTGHIPAGTPVGPANLTWIAALPNGEVIVADMESSGYPVTIVE